MTSTSRVYLVPGFFGFTNLGDLSYWGHVHHFLGDHLGLPVHAVPTPPTASLRARATALAAAIAATAGPDDPLVLIGHSSGGLDARLLCTPGVDLGVDVESIAARVTCVVTASTPHAGTPIAGTFATLQGRHVLRLLSAATALVLRRRSLPLSLVVRLGEVLTLADAPNGVLDNLYEQLLGSFTDERRGQVRELFESVERDQSLLEQLRPEAIDAFNAATRDRPGVRYGCVVTRAKPPALGEALKTALSPAAQASYAWYLATWTLASRSDPALLPALDDAQRRQLAQLERFPEPADNDGMVPTLSQVRGEVIRAVDADHLDLLGHFGDADQDPPQVDWIRTGSGFDREGFARVWGDVADFVTRT